MITKRIIPCLDVKDGRVVKGVQFAGLKDVASPVQLAQYYSQAGADELVFYDITASAEGRGIFTDILCETARRVFIPLTVGGGIRTLDDFERVLNSGADKVSVNSGAIDHPNIIAEAAKRYGDQCVVLSADIKRVGEEYHVFARGGREVRARKQSHGLVKGWKWVSERSLSIAWIPTGSDKDLICRCSNSCVMRSMFRSLHRAAPAVLRIFWNCLSKYRRLMRDWLHPFFILEQ